MPKAESGSAKNVAWMMGLIAAVLAALFSFGLNRAASIESRLVAAEVEQGKVQERQRSVAADIATVNGRISSADAHMERLDRKVELLDRKLDLLLWRQGIDPSKAER